MYLTALLVDDNDLSLMVCEELIGAYNIRVQTAAGGAEALRYAAANAFDIIFLDHIMPEMDGPETCRNLRALKDYADTPIIALTGNEVAQYAALYKTVGMSDATTKPMDPDELDALLKKWLGDKVKLADEASEESDVPEWFTVLSGVKRIDVARALELMRGSYDALRRMLDSFCRQVETKTVFMEDALSRGAFNDYAIEAHSFKGSLNNIGAGALSECARELEIMADAKDPEGLRRQNDTLMWGVRALSKIIADTRAARADNQPKGDVSELKEALKTILAAMEDYETDDAVTLVAEIKGKSFSEAIDKEIFEMNVLLDSYEYNEFIAKTEALMTTLGG
ncbi:hypothetical protein FACS1894202_04990 [Clostridia bacterium]|nr:hypothetical protein FACS1894202_04990 [Clostridia bacterium]